MEVRTLKWDQENRVTYCIPLWLRDEYIKLACARSLPRIEAHHEKRSEPIAVVCFGPSLNQTWEQVKAFPYVMTCSGSHKFLIERGIVPTWHVEVDPRPHKITLLGKPHEDVQYLPASTCHPEYFDHLQGYNVCLWHVFDSKQDAIRTLPPGEWALTGGCSVGLRAMTIARFFGFTDMHIFGMDGSYGESCKHPPPHPNQMEGAFPCEYKGVTYQTQPSFLEAAKQTWHELDQMPDVKATFYGEGLVQAMWKHYKPNPVAEEKMMIGFNKPELISATYRELNTQLHRDNLAYGVSGERHAPTILKLSESLKTKNILDYGCGKGRLGKAIPWAIAEYDPAVPGKEESPKAADIVVCTDVLEHIEPEKLMFVLADLARCVRQVGYFTIHAGPAKKTLADGRNTHLIQQQRQWWKNRLKKFFEIGKMIQVGPELHVVAGPKHRKQKRVPMSTVQVAQEPQLAEAS